ncbi:MAG: class I SAM-dependent DNA methyltransferase [Candidatus Merdivicinus sp.]|jgi:SAM-dependent methyltransferase
MSHYSQFASVYDLLTSEIDYQKRGSYFDARILENGGFRGILLDLGCGTGSLSEVMAGIGYDVIGVDNSEEMLWAATKKRIASGRDITYLCQEMTGLDLYGTVDAVVCALDTLNHLTDYDDFCQAIARAALFLHPDGVFVFDLNTPYKHAEILADNAFLYDYDDVFCAWQNTLEEDGIVQMDLTIFASDEDGSYRRMEESFAERAYSLEQVEEALRRAGLVLSALYAEDSTEPPAPDTQRWVFVAKHVRLEEDGR